MAKQTAPRRGTAFWLSDTDGPLLRAVAIAEDRPLSNVLSRAVRLYAERSPEYQGRVVEPAPAPGGAARGGLRTKQARRDKTA